ncbi:MAG: beta strand repeat-containing protein [Bacteroidales bacterium]
MKKLFLLIVFAAALTNVFATNYYWVGGVGTSGSPKSWSSGSNWSTSSGGSAASVVPGSGDVAIFDGSTGNISPFVDINNLNITIAGLQVYPLSTNNVVSFVNTASSFTITGDLTINKLSTTVYGQISDYGVNTITVQGNINTNTSGSYALVAVPATNSNLSAGKIALTGTNPIIQDIPTSPASVTATISANKVTALTIVSGGSGYLAAPTVAFSGGGGAGAAATLTLTNGVVTGYTITNGGTTNYTSAPTVTLSYGSNIGFQNLDISGSSNVSFTTGNALTINGNLNIQSGGKLTITKTLQFVSTAPSGSNPFISPGTISGTGVIVGNSNWSFVAQGTLPASYTTSNLQSVGTLYLDPTSATTSTVNSIQQNRLYSTVTFAPAYQSSGVPTIAVAGGLTINGGVLNDGGNTITLAGSISIVSSNTTAGLAVHTGTGRLKLIRNNTNITLVTAGKNVAVGNLEVGSASGVGPYNVGAATNLTINGTLTISKAQAGIINASGSNITFQNADVPILLSAAGTITTDASTVLNFGSAGNTGGAAFTVPNNLFATAPSITSFTVNRDNTLTFNNQALTVSGATTITKGTLAMATTLTANGAVTVNGTFQLNSGGWATGSGAWTYGGSGILAFNATYGVDNTHVYWPTTNGPANVSVLAGILTLNSGANRTVSGLFQTSGGVAFPSASLTLNGTAQINAGGYFSNAPTYGASSTLKYNNGAVYGRATEWNSTSPASVQISNNSTLNYPSGSIVAAKTLTGNLTVDAGSAFYMDYGSVGQSNPLSIGGNVILNGNLGLGGAIGGDLNVGGNWTRGSASNLYANTRAVAFNGSAAQTITSAVSGGESFDYLTIYNTSGDVTVNTPMTVNNSLSFSSGKLILGANDLTIGSSASISGATATKYIVTNGAGKLVQTVGAGATKTFPIGASTSSYDPATVTPTSASVMSANVSGTLTGSQTPSNVYYHPREWVLASATPTSTVIALTPSQLNATSTTKYGTGLLGGSNYTLADATYSTGTYSNTYSSFGSFVTACLDIAVGVNNALVNKSSIYGEKGNVVVENAKGRVEIYAASGKLVRALNSTTDRLNVSLEKGLYIVRNGATSSKVLVK